MQKEETASLFENKSLKRLHFRLVAFPYLLHRYFFYISPLSDTHLHTLPKRLVGWRVTTNENEIRFSCRRFTHNILSPHVQLTTFAINLYRHFHHFLFSKLRVGNQLLC